MVCTATMKCDHQDPLTIAKERTAGDHLMHGIYQMPTPTQMPKDLKEKRYCADYTGTMSATNTSPQQMTRVPLRNGIPVRWLHHHFHCIWGSPFQPSDLAAQLNEAALSSVSIPIPYKHIWQSLKSKYMQAVTHSDSRFERQPKAKHYNHSWFCWQCTNAIGSEWQAYFLSKLQTKSSCVLFHSELPPFLTPSFFDQNSKPTSLTFQASLICPDLDSLHLSTLPQISFFSVHLYK